MGAPLCFSEMNDKFVVCFISFACFDDKFVVVCFLKELFYRFLICNLLMYIILNFVVCLR